MILAEWGLVCLKKDCSVMPGKLAKLEPIVILTKGWVKVKVTLEQATKAHEGGEV